MDFGSERRAMSQTPSLRRTVCVIYRTATVPALLLRLRECRVRKIASCVMQCRPCAVLGRNGEHGVAVSQARGRGTSGPPGWCGGACSLLTDTTTTTCQKTSCPFGGAPCRTEHTVLLCHRSIQLCYARSPSWPCTVSPPLPSATPQHRRRTTAILENVHTMGRETDTCCQLLTPFSEKQSTIDKKHTAACRPVGPALAEAECGRQIPAYLWAPVQSMSRNVVS